MATKKDLTSRPRRTARYYYLRFIRLQGDPEFLARGVAAGLFIGVTPTIPLHTFLTLLLAFLFRGSKLAAIMAGWVVSNPFTFFFQYYFSWRLGSWITGSDLSWGRISGVVARIGQGPGLGETLSLLGKLSQETVMVMLAGGFILAVPIALLGYLGALRFFAVVRRHRQGEKRAGR
ncbi:MAG: DUF2062 domain-containing protein [Desulfobacteraceae bacterium]|nr:DUF2062 domain-containing protein [Desulfobacteraceae bacterium]